MNGVSDCAKYNTLISAAADGELGIDEKVQLEEHLRSCEQCRSYLEMMRKMSAALRDSAEEPPEKLSEWIMADVKLHNTRRIFGAYGRYTALAAVLCLVILGAAALRPRLAAGKNAMKSASPDAAPMSVSAEKSAVGDTGSAYGYADEETYDDLADGADGPMQAVNEAADPEAVYAYAADTAENAEEDYEADGQPAQAEPGDALSEFDTSRGYKKYAAADYDEKFFEVAVIYGEAPEELADCEILLSEGEQTDYRVPKELMQSLGSEGAFSEIYFDDLLGEYGLVIVLN